MGNLITTFDKTSIDPISTYRTNAGGKTRIFTERISNSANITNPPFTSTESSMFFLQTYVAGDNIPLFQIASGINGQIKRRFTTGTGASENWSSWFDLKGDKGDTGTVSSSTGLTVGSSSVPATSNLFGPLNVTGDVTVGTTAQNRNATFNGNLTYKILTNTNDINVSSDFEVFLDPQFYALQADGSIVNTLWRSSINNYSFTPSGDVKFFRTGGFNNGPYVKLNNTTNATTGGAFFNGGNINFNNFKTTGFTIVMIYRINGSNSSADRLIDFGTNPTSSGQSNLIIHRDGSTNNVKSGYYAGDWFPNTTWSSGGQFSYTVNQQTPTLSDVIDNNWNVYTITYSPTNPSYNFWGSMTFYKNGNIIKANQKTTGGFFPGIFQVDYMNANISNADLNFAFSYLGKSNWSSDAFTNMDIGGFFILKKTLSQTEVSNYSNFNNTNFTASDGTFTNNLNVGGNVNGTNLNISNVSRNNNPSWSLYTENIPPLRAPATVTYNRNATTTNNVNVNLSTGIVTITVAGRYYISFSAFSHNDIAAGQPTSFELRKNNVNNPPIRSYSQQQVASMHIAINPITVILDLVVGDTVSIYLGAGALHGNQNCYFSGYMIS